jgi:sugar phosphate isomerase/epimerase
LAAGFTGWAAAVLCPSCGTPDPSAATDPRTVAPPASADGEVSAQTFAPALGVCRGVDQGPLALSCGAAYLEVACGPSFLPTEPEPDYANQRARLHACPVPIRAANSFLPGWLHCTGDHADHAAVETYASAVFERAAEVGVRTITFGSSSARAIPEGFSRELAELQFVSLLSRLAPLAAEHDLTIGVEALQKAETNFIHHVSEATRLVQAVQHDAVGLTVDIFHMLRGAEGPESILEAGDLVAHVHIAELAERTPPGQDGDDFRPYLQALKQVGYDGPISVEARWHDMASELPLALQTLTTQISELD